MANPLKFISDALGGNLLGGANKIIDQFVDDPQEKAKAEAMLAEEERKLQSAIMEYEQKRIEEQSKTVRAEIKGQSWMQRNWRPLTALIFVFIIANNFIFVPYVSAFGANVPTLDIPQGMWALLNVMIGGYTAARSWEKVRGAADNSIPSITDKVLQRIGDATEG